MQLNHSSLQGPPHAGEHGACAHTQTGSPSVCHSVSGFNVYYHGQHSYPI